MQLKIDIGKLVVCSNLGCAWHRYIPW